jgi:hypothetical protein
MSLPRVREPLGQPWATPANPASAATAFAFEPDSASAIISKAHDKYVKDPMRAFEAQVRNAANQAHTKFEDRPRKCYKATAHFMRLMGVASAVNPSASSRGMPLSHLLTLIDIGKLKPGMQIYVSRKPGTDPESLNLGNLPHWAIYVGRDDKGFPRFMDQYRKDWGLTEFEAEYGPTRKIDTIFDPLHAKRPMAAVVPQA